MLVLLTAASIQLAAITSSEAAVAASAAVRQGHDVPAGVCRVRFPNTCLCRQGSCADCDHCAGCPDHLCVGLPGGAASAMPIELDSNNVAVDPQRMGASFGKFTQIA